VLVDDGAAVNLMSYYVFKKLGREDGKLIKTNLTLNDVRATRWRLEASSQWSSLWGASRLLLLSSSSGCKVTTILFWDVIGFMPIGVCLLLCISF
jgi:hypothetical protein